MSKALGRMGRVTDHVFHLADRTKLGNSGGTYWLTLECGHVVVRKASKLPWRTGLEGRLVKCRQCAGQEGER
jgi:hypothetical protein